MLAVRQSLREALEELNPQSVRQSFYGATTRGVIPKTEAAYKNVVVRLLGLMRREGEIPFDWIADATRWMRKPTTHSSMQSMLERTARTYRQAIWDDQDVYVEIWLEKEALAGVVYDVTAEWDVPLMVTRGYPSISYLHSAAESMEYEEKPCFLYYFGDHDPSGVDIDRKVEADLREFAPDVDLHFERLAVTVEQIEAWNLPTRPTKKTDTRAKNFKGDSVELDAIPPAKLRELVRNCIEQHVDHGVLARTRTIEAAERATLVKVLEGFDAA
ncbi:MAG: hypothetical protein HQ582_15860 [Planctomycetes bacterium]|nr:hypothetical protein [Planctomycetota bacterium]